MAEPVPGLISIAGGKYTTYRVMAVDTIDVVADGLERAVPKSCTEDVTVLGSENWDAYKDNEDEIALAYDLPVELVRRLLWRHGSRIDDVLTLAANDSRLAIVLGDLYLAAEVVHAARHEGAIHLEDVLARRLRISIESEERGTLVADAAADLMAEELGWDDDRQADEVATWHRRVRAEREANDAPDDIAADALRRRAVDARGLIDDDESE